MANQFQNSICLVVGGAGFVGSNLVLQLLEHDPKQILVVDNLISADAINVPDHSKVQFIMGSIADEQLLWNLPNDLDFVFHLSCYHGNQSSIYNPLADHENNTLTSLRLFERLKDIRGLKKVVYAAAGCAVAEKTFDNPSATQEDAPISLYHDSPYSISKLIGELYGNYYWKQHDLPIVKARFQNVFGPREILGAGQWRGTPHTVWRNVVPTFVWRSLNKEPLPLENSGNASRDFIYVDDIVRGLMACAQNGEAGDVYNLATGKETTIGDLANIINSLTGNYTPVNLQPARSWDRSGRRFGDPAKSRDKLGFEAKTSIEEGLAKTVEWTQENVGQIRRCMSRQQYFLPEIKQYL